MLISEKHGFVFFHNPKAAGTALTAVLGRYVEGAPPPPKDDALGWQQKYHVRGLRYGMHAPAWCVSTDLSDKVLVGVIRNPWDWVRSNYQTWLWKKGPRSGNPPVPPSVESLKEYLRLQTTKEHPPGVKLSVHGPNLQSCQLEWFERPPGQFIKTNARRILRYENLQAEFDLFCDRVGIQRDQIPTRNASGSMKPNPEDIYNEETVDLVGSMFRRDVEFFDYEYPWG